MALPVESAGISSHGWFGDPKEPYENQSQTLLFLEGVPGDA